MYQFYIDGNIELLRVIGQGIYFPSLMFSYIVGIY